MSESKDLFIHSFIHSFINVEEWDVDAFIVIRNRKIVWKHGSYCWHFCLKLKYPRWPYSEYIKTAKNGGLVRSCSVKMTWGCFSHFMLLWLLCQDSEAVQKTVTDQKDYNKCSSCVIVGWIAKIYVSITVKKCWLRTY